MGFLTEGATLTWQEIQSPVPVILAAHEHGSLPVGNNHNHNHHENHEDGSSQTVAAKILTDGVRQFLSIWRGNKPRANNPFLWGDEVEYVVVVFDSESKHVKLCLRASDVLATLQTLEADERFSHLAHWAPEYGSFMIEGTPAAPYVGFVDVERSMVQRRKMVEELLAPNERIMSVTSFPQMGVGQFTEPYFPPMGPIARSRYVPDEIINPHKRFGTLTANIRERRGSNVEILLPVFPDTATAGHELQPHPNFVHLDAMGFGMGCCCVQCTFQTHDIDEARYLYDQFVVISPILLALSAACPIARGYLVDTDVRWHIIAGAVDDRTPEERGLVPSDKPPIPKSRYESVSLYISNDPTLKDEYNDLNAPYNHDAFATLREAGVDARLAKHIAHLFIRDPLVIYANKIELDNEQHTDHFENIQSTNWQTVRFKPPPTGGKIGWRVEFRVIEVQLTEFTNAAYATFVALLSRVITESRPDFYIPMSKVDENMETAKRRDAARSGSFYFRTHTSDSSDTSVQLKSVNEILNGVDGGFVGLIPLVRTYVDSLSLPQEDAKRLHSYLRYLSLRASGELITVATWIRNFVQEHPKYQHDSIVSDEIAYDLLRTCDDITHGRLHVPELFGDLPFSSLDA